MTAERQGGVRRLQAALRGGFVDDIIPASRPGGAGVHVKTIAVAGGERQVAQEIDLPRIEPRAGPFDGKRRLVVHALVRAGCGAVMIAAERDRASGDQTTHRVDDETGVRAISHIVAEEDEAIDGVTTRMRETGFEGL